MKSEPSSYFLVGPTASGKSELGVRLARSIGAEILSLDSMQVFRGMDIGTAKLGAEQRQGVPHHLMDLVDPLQEFSVAEYRRLADLKIAELHGRGRKPLFVGGTALYLKVMTHGLFHGGPMDAQLRQKLVERAETEGDEVLHRELKAVDPKAAARIHLNDRKRVIRALEVFQLTGSPISELQKQWTVPSEGPKRIILGLRVPKELLHRRIELRVHTMFELGWMDEVKALLKQGGFGRQSSQALGYREILQHLEGKFDFESCRAEIIKKTRIFARRQMTWLRSFPEIRWIDSTGQESAEMLLQRALLEIEKGS